MGRRKGSKNKPKNSVNLAALESKTVKAFESNLEAESVAAGVQPKKRGRKSLKEAGREALSKKNAYEPYQLSAENYRSDLLHALVWHQNNSSEEKLKSWAIKFVRESLGEPALADALSKLPDYEFGTFGKLCRLFDMGADLQARELDHLSNYVSKLKAKIEFIKEDKSVKKPTIQDRFEKQASDLSGFLDAHLDLQMGHKKGKKDTVESRGFCVKVYLEAQNIKKPIPPQVARVMSTFYQKQLDEFNLVKSKSDKVLTEAYSTTKKANLQKGIEFLQETISSCNDFAKEHKSTGVKLRKRKPKPPAKVVAKMKFQLKDDKLNLRSVDPAKIVDAGEVWVFDTKKRNLTVYRAQASKALTVKGTTLLNFDEDTSESKKIRKPEKFFIGAIDWTKRPLTKAFNEIRGLTKKPKGRMNKESIIVKVF